MTRCDPQRLNHQTVRLTRGPNSSPDEGVCAMELASMLAGEPFSDRPISVSAVITGVLRTHNDRIDDRRRQDLYHLRGPGRRHRWRRRRRTCAREALPRAHRLNRGALEAPVTAGGAPVLRRPGLAVLSTRACP